MDEATRREIRLAAEREVERELFEIERGQTVAGLREQHRADFEESEQGVVHLFNRVTEHDMREQGPAPDRGGFGEHKEEDAPEDGFQPRGVLSTEEAHLLLSSGSPVTPSGNTLETEPELA